jgi:hypothetical protein
MAHAVQSTRFADSHRQLALYGTPAPDRGTTTRRGTRRRAMCAGCRAREARYGFSDEAREQAIENRPRALCFECFRIELDRRQAIRARRVRGWNAEQVGLPLDGRLRELARRRRRAQIAARHALGL